MTNPETVRRNGKVTVVVVLFTLLVITGIASYTYLESMGRLTPQFALWVMPTLASSLAYLKSYQAEGRTAEVTEVQRHELAVAQALATAALAALPATTANRIITEQSAVSTVDEAPGTVPGR